MWLGLWQEHAGKQAPGPGSGRGRAPDELKRLQAARARAAELAGQLEAILHVRRGHCVLSRVSLHRCGATAHSK